MRTWYECEAVFVVELFGDVLAKVEPGTTGRHIPPAAVVGVGPQQVAHGPCVRVRGVRVRWGRREGEGGDVRGETNISSTQMRARALSLALSHACAPRLTLVGNLLDAVHGADVVEALDVGGETTVEAEDLPLHKTRQGQVVKQVCTRVGACGVVWWGVVWCGEVWCGEVRCGVVWCGEDMWVDTHTTNNIPVKKVHTAGDAYFFMHSS
jgi:hypothetical protein